MYTCIALSFERHTLLLSFFFHFVEFGVPVFYLFTLCEYSEQILYGVVYGTDTRTHAHTIHLYSEFDIENDSNSSDQIKCECDMGA